MNMRTNLNSLLLAIYYFLLSCDITRSSSLFLIILEHEVANNRMQIFIKILMQRKSKYIMIDALILQIIFSSVHK